MDAKVVEMLENRASELGVQIESEEFALKMDASDPCAEIRDLFNYPKMKDLPSGLFCSLDDRSLFSANYLHHVDEIYSFGCLLIMKVTNTVFLDLCNG